MGMRAIMAEIGGLTSREMQELQAMGWIFLPFGPDEWQWMKFCKLTGANIAIQCDRTWKYDLAYTNFMEKK